MNIALYGGLFTDDPIARIRCLVKGTVIVGNVQLMVKAATGAFKQNLKKSKM